MLHYNFPPYSVGECGRMMGAGRREIGHGRLARRGVAAVLPTQEEFPYTIRIEPTKQRENINGNKKKKKQITH